MRMLPVIGLKFCITWNLATLLRGVFTLRPMYRAWLERFFVALSRNLVIPFLVALVVSVTTIAITAILPLEVGALEPFRPSVARVVTPVTSFCCVADLLIKPLAKLMMHIASDALLDLAFMLLLQRSICNLRIVDVLEVLSK
jgi:hypothetical protein